jgi:hypothetical protein
MKHIVFFAMLTMASAAFAQAKPEAPKAEAPKAEAAQPESPKPAAAAAKPQAKATAVAKKHSSRRSEDARQCLERATNDDIIKCAEEYL